MPKRINIYIADQDVGVYKRFVRRLKLQRVSLSLWMCKRMRDEEESAAAAEKLLEKEV